MMKNYLVLPLLLGILAGQAVMAPSLNAEEKQLPISEESKSNSTADALKRSGQRSGFRRNAEAPQRGGTSSGLHPQLPPPDSIVIDTSEVYDPPKRSPAEPPRIAGSKGG